MYEYRAEVVKVVDGDTLHVSIDLGLDVRIRVTIRLAGINAPELSTAEGKEAKAWVQQWVEDVGIDGWVVVHTVKDRREKYGRYLGHVFSVDGPGSEYLNNDLIVNGFAVPYMS